METKGAGGVGSAGSVRSASVFGSTRTASGDAAVNIDGRGGGKASPVTVVTRGGDDVVDKGFGKGGVEDHKWASVVTREGVSEL